jgi:hypothetical protein
MFIGNLTSDAPLPMELITKLDVSVEESAGDQLCSRCGRRWSAHIWVLFVATSTVLDCSLKPRDREGF